MQSESQDASSLDLRLIAEDHTSLRANQRSKSDARRFAGIFPLEFPEGVVSALCGNAAHEERNDPDDIPRLESAAALDMDTSTTQVTSVASTVECSTLSAAQQIVACYRAFHDSGDDATAEIRQKELPEDSEDPEEQHSMCTLGVSTETQPTMDMMWRPKLKVHMRRTDQRALMQAKSQAIAMMHNAGLKPTNKIQCRRRGCPDILPNVEALKYHIHIHNIADSTAKCRNTSPSLVEGSTSGSRVLKRKHSHSKTSLGTCSTTYSLPRTPSAGSLFPSLLSPRETTPDVPKLAVTKDSSDPSSSNQAGLLPVCTDETSLVTHIPSRGRRTGNEGIAISVAAECRPSITMMLSSPSPPITHGPLALRPHAKFPVVHSFGSAADNGSAAGSAHSVSRELTESRNPLRALSPTRAMGPIRNGIRRILTIEGPNSDANK